MARERFPAIATTEGLTALLEGTAPDEIMDRIEQEGGYTLSESALPDGIRITFTPILAGRQVAGMVLTVVSDALSSYHSHSPAARTADALHSSLRDSIGNIFGEMDTIALKADFLRMGWIKPGLNRIGVEAYRMLRVASNLAEYMKLLDGDLNLRAEIIDLAGELSARSDAITEIGRGIGIPVECNITGAACFVQGDSGRLEMAIYNILHNSFYYTRPENRVILNLEQQDNQAVLTVRDSGIGISEKLMPDIWLPYVASLYSGRTSGVGLGLTLAKAVIEAHGGEISLTSQEMRGTCVTVRLPTARILSTPLPFAQENGALYAANRFSTLYNGLADVVGSPYLQLPDEG